MQRLGTNTSSIGPWWGRKEQTESVNVPLMTGTRGSHNSVSKGNLVSCVHVGGNRTCPVRPEKFQFLEKGQNRNFGYKIVISVKNLKFIL